MATVYRARDPRLGREVAVKVIHKHLRENAEVGTRFVAEARAAAKLRHPGIVDVFDVSNEEDAERYLVAELIRGTTLRKVLQRHRDMPAEIGAAMVLQICEALEHAHASSIIHRDIKPENVLVELPADRAAAAAAILAASGAVGKAPPSSGDHDTPAPSAPGDSGPKRHGRRDPGVVIKITDFGIAKILDAQGVTSTGQVLGSPAHMAPEQIEGGDVDARTDVFALGVLMYECLVGHLPFEGKNPAQVLRRVLEGTYPAADRERSTVGGRWSTILARALAREASARTASAAQLGEQIRVELAALGIDDGYAEISAYFADPAAYTEGQAARLVPRLVARGEAARKSGDIPGAAADFNRALALSPDDLTILKRIGHLTSSAGRRQMLRRAGAVGAILGGSVLLGLAAFQVARAVKASGSTRDTGSALTGVKGPASGETAAPPVSAEPPATSVESAVAPPLPSGSASSDPGKRVRVPATPSFTLPAPPPSGAAAAGTRKVRFNLTPKGAKLSVDGSLLTSWLQEMSLSVGAHAVEVIPNVERCCDRFAGRITIEAAPASAPDSVQQIGLAMAIRPAVVSLSGAPQNAQLSCPALALTCFAGSSKQVKLTEPSWSGRCTFTAPDKPPRQGHVTLNAGETNALPWPSD
jgi:serine/threonine-protein kinase